MILRRPNRRSSTANAPGPRNSIAAVMITAKTVGNLASNRFRVAAGNHANPLPIVPSPTEYRKWALEIQPRVKRRSRSPRCLPSRFRESEFPGQRNRVPLG
jgi:hypothetical protein